MNLEKYGPGRNRHSPGGTSKHAKLVATLGRYQHAHGDVDVAGFTEVVGTRATRDGTVTDIEALGTALGMSTPKAYLINVGFPTGSGVEWVAICIDSQHLTVTEVGQRYPGLIDEGNAKFPGTATTFRRSTFNTRIDQWEPMDLVQTPPMNMAIKPAKLAPGHRLIATVTVDTGGTTERFGFLHNRFTNSWIRREFMSVISTFIGGHNFTTNYDEWDHATGTVTQFTTARRNAFDTLTLLGGDFNQNPPSTPPAGLTPLHTGYATTRAAEEQSRAEVKLDAIDDIRKKQAWPASRTSNGTVVDLTLLTHAEKQVLIDDDPITTWDDYDLDSFEKDEWRVFMIHNHIYDWFIGPTIPPPPLVVEATGRVPFNPSGSDHLGIGIP